MPIKKKVDKKKKLKQKQKQKQVVKQNVKVTVQSSGGSGGGGSSVPSRFTDTSGENVRLQGLIEQLSRRIPAPVVMPVEQSVLVQKPVEIPAVFSKPRALQEERAKAKLEALYESNSSNDNETVNKVFNAPNNNNNSISERILADKLQQIDPEGYEANLDDIQGVFNSNLNNKFVDEAGEEFVLTKKLEKVKGLKKDVDELEALAGMLQRRGKEAFAESGIEAPYGLTASGRIRKKPLGSKKVTYQSSEGEM